MKKLGLLLILLLGIQQAKAQNDGYWNLETRFGTITFNNAEFIGDKTNVGLDVEVARTFTNRVFVASSITFSTLRSTTLWENPLEYFSANLDLGYKFDTGGLSDVYIAAGGSYISAANTVPNSESTFSFNLTAGAIFWLRDSKLGISIRNTYKTVSNAFMRPHNRFAIGMAYKL